MVKLPIYTCRLMLSDHAILKSIISFFYIQVLLSTRLNFLNRLLFMFLVEDFLHCY